MTHGQSHAPGASYSDCPNCGYKKSLSVTAKNGRNLFHCHAGCNPSDLLAVMQGRTPSHTPRVNVPSKKDHDSTKQYAFQLFNKGEAADGTLAAIYLRNRSILLHDGSLPSTLRFLSNHCHRPSNTYWPVMLAAVTDYSGRVQAVHRTYLARNGRGKAPVEPAKMTLGAIGGFACHLAPAGEELAISEGIETGLSVQVSTGIPTWAALSAGGVQNLILPPLPLAAAVIIAADADPMGIKSAFTASMRWRNEGRKVRIAVPPSGQDFNDILLGATS